MKLKIPSFRDASVLVIGDVMLDRYWYGKTGRVSQEAPVPIVDIESSEDRPGGAANVALNLASLGVDVTLIGVVGDDDAAVTLRRKLAAANVRCELVGVADWSTILKVRVVSRRQQMLRIDFEKPIAADIEGAAGPRVSRTHRKAADVVVIEDYDKGTLARPQRYIDIAHEHGKRVVVDPKFKPFEAYRGADVIKPNIAEFTHAVGGWTDYRELVSKAAELVRASRLRRARGNARRRRHVGGRAQRRASSRCRARGRRVRRNRRRRHGGSNAGGGTCRGLQRARERDAGECGGGSRRHEVGHRNGDGAGTAPRTRRRRTHRPRHPVARRTARSG